MSKKPATVKFGPCKQCGERFRIKRKNHVFCTSKCRFTYWDRNRMDFRAVLRKLDIIIERLPEKAVGIKEGGK
jgi:hypothetical protein